MVRISAPSIVSTPADVWGYATKRITHGPIRYTDIVAKGNGTVGTSGVLLGALFAKDFFGCTVRFIAFSTAVATRMHLCTLNRAAAVLGVAGGTWATAPGSLANATDENLATLTDFGYTVQAGDDLSYITWDLGALYADVIVQVKVLVQGGTGSPTTARVKSSPDATTWTTLAEFAQAAGASADYNCSAKPSGNVRYIRITAWRVSGTGTTCGIRVYEVLAGPVVANENAAQDLALNTLGVLTLKPTARRGIISAGLAAQSGSGSGKYWIHEDDVGES